MQIVFIYFVGNFLIKKWLSLKNENILFHISYIGVLCCLFKVSIGVWITFVGTENNALLILKSPE